MRFTKMHGLGNDFVFVEARELPQGDLSQLAARVCDRHFGIGADGLVVLVKEQGIPWQMYIYNADGSEAEMCGNALRCVGKYLYEEGHLTLDELQLMTHGGTLRHLKLRVEGNRVSEVTVDMGEPILEPRLIPALIPDQRGMEWPLVLDEREFLITLVSMGNPHCVIFCPEVDSVPLEQWGPALENDPIFPRKTNVEFVQVLSPTHARVRVWERGVGPTLACGSGASAVLVAGVITGRLERQARIELPGGLLTVTWREDNNRIELTGPAAKVFSGEIHL